MSLKSIADRLGDHLVKIKPKTSEKKQSTKSQQTEGKKLELTDGPVDDCGYRTLRSLYREHVDRVF